MTETVQTQIDKLAAKVEPMLSWWEYHHGPNAYPEYQTTEDPFSTPPGDGDHGAEPCEESRNNNGVCRGLCAYCAPSSAPDEAAKWKEVADVFDDHPEIAFGDDRDAVIEARIQAAHAAVAKAIELRLAAPADRAVVVTDAMVGDVKALLSAARETINQSDDGWLGREYDPNPLATAVERVGEHVADIEAALRAAERGEG